MNSTRSFVQITDPLTGAPPDFDFIWTFSAEAWIRVDALAASAGGSSTIVSKGSEAIDGSSVWRWFISSTGTLEFEIRDRSAAEAVRHVRTTHPVIQAGTAEFRHVAVTMDLDQQSLQMYVDGTEVATTLVQSSVIPRLIPGNGTIRIGVGFQNANYFRGMVDELSFYNKVLTPSQVAGIYDAGAAGKCAGPTQQSSPDLAVAGFLAFAWQGQPSVLQGMTASWRVDNIGKGLGTLGGVNRLTLSRDRQQRDILQQWYSSYPAALPFGSSYNVHIEFLLPDIPPGDYFLRAESLPASTQESDANLGDNALILPIHIGLLDLAPMNLFLTAETNAQGLVWKIQWQVKNTGDVVYPQGNALGSWILSNSPDPGNRVASWQILTEFETIRPGGMSVQVTRILPPNLPSRQYYLILVLRSHLDANRNNDTVAIPVFLPPADLPDLTIRRLGRNGSDGPFEAVAGEDVPVTWQVDNVGKGRALGTWTDRFSFTKGTNTDPAIVLSGVTLPSESRNVFANGSYSNMAYVVIPRDLDAGIYSLIAEVDISREIPEVDRANNSRIVSVTVREPYLPDLAVSDTRWGGVPSPGETLEVRFRVTNLGPAPTAGLRPWTNTIALSASPDGQQPIAVRSVSSSRHLLRLGSDEVIITDFRLPMNLAGSYYLVATINSDWVTEVTERNNKQVIPITIEKPDLAVSQLAWSGKARGGEALTVSWRVENVGRGSVSDYRGDRLVLSSSPSLSGAVQTWDLDATHSAPGGSDFSIPPTSVRLWGHPPGTYYLIAVADALNLRPELSETNNTQVLPITLGGADLVATELHAGAESVAAGSELAISWNVRTTAPQDYSGFWTDRVLLYATPEKPEPVGSWEFSRHRTISTTTGYSDHETIRLPSVPPGQYSLVLRTDSLNTITESDEANNQAVIALKLTNLPPVVTLRAPLNAPSLLSCLPPSVLLSATLELGSYQVQRVDYYDADTLIGTALGDLSGSPVKSSLLAHGQHLLTARATDAWGLTVTSAPVSLSIERPSLNHLLAETALDGSVICCMGAEPGLSYVVESTDGRVSEPAWTARWTNSPTDSLLIFTNRPNRTQQLFRIKIAP